jgi:hypothetical protein
MTLVRKRPGVRVFHASAEDQRHLAWSIDVEVFTNNLLEKQPACHWPVEHLGQGKLRL